MKIQRLVVAAALASFAASTARADVLTIATNPQGSLYFSVGSALAKVMDEKLKLQVRVQPMAGSSTYIPLINRNEANFGCINVDDLLNAFKGTGNFEGKPNPDLRVLSVMFPLPLGILVPADSPAKSIKDVKGFKMPSGYAGQTTGRVLTAALLANGGLSVDDVKPVPAVNIFQGTDMLGAGKVDAAVISMGVAQVQKANVDLASRGGVRFLPLDMSPEAIARMKKELPSKALWVEPGKNNVGITERMPVMGYSIFLVSNKEMTDEAAYNLAKMLHASKEPLAASAPALNGFDPASMTEQTEVPYHPGAIKFFTEIKQWPPAS